MLTKDQAIDKLMHIPKEDLYELCYESHKDQYGISGTHMYQYTVPELVSWYIIHYIWNEQKQCFESAVPFEENQYA
jgi:hypothetical protein